MPDTRPLRFAPRPLATLLTLAATILFAALGDWQLDRAAEKRAQAADFAGNEPAIELPFDSRELPRYRRVTARGRYDSEHQFLLDNRTRDGRAGVEVLTPFLLSDGGAIVVNRGWLPLGADRAVLPSVPVATDARRVAGRLDRFPRPSIELASTPGAGWPRIVSFPRGEDLARMLGRELHPQQILLDGAEPDGYARDWRLPGTTPMRHLGYAIQWFAFAATAVAIWIAVSLRRDGESR